MDTNCAPSLGGFQGIPNNTPRRGRVSFLGHTHFTHCWEASRFQGVGELPPTSSGPLRTMRHCWTAHWFVSAWRTSKQCLVSSGFLMRNPKGSLNKDTPTCYLHNTGKSGQDPKRHAEGPSIGLQTGLTFEWQAIRLTSCQLRQLHARSWTTVTRP